MTRHLYLLALPFAIFANGCGPPDGANPIADASANVSPTEPSRKLASTPVTKTEQPTELAPSIGVPLTSPSPPKPVPFDIQGMKIGDRLTDEFAYSHCPAKDKGKPDITGSDSIEINGKSVFVFFQFDEFKLIGVQLLFDPGAFETLVDVYSQKFGCPPHKVDTSIVKTRLNAEFTNTTASWVTDSGPFIIAKYGNSIDKGFATLRSPEYVKYLERQQSKDTESLRDKL